MATKKAANEGTKKLSKADFWAAQAKVHGAGIIPGGEEVDRVSTGSPLIDVVLGGGLPLGRVVEIYGPEAAGKTSLCLSTIVEGQKRGMEVVYIDVEHALDANHNRKLGVLDDQITIVQPDSAEQALDLVQAVIEGGLADIVVLDSVAALATEAELAGNAGDVTVASVARVLGAALRRIVPAAAKSGTLVIFINQLRDRISIGGPGGSGKITPGGNSLKYSASIRIDIVRTGNVTQGDSVVGIKQKITTRKNKTAPPFRVAETAFYFDRGYDPVGELVEAALASSILYRRGAWYYTEVRGEEERLGQGASKAIEALESDQALYDLVTAAVRGQVTKQVALED